MISNRKFLYSVFLFNAGFGARFLRASPIADPAQVLDTAGFALHGVDVRARRVVVAEGE